MQRKDISKKVIRFCRVAFIIAIICAVILAMAVMAYAQPYSVTDLGTLGGETSYVDGINSYGQAIGISVTNLGVVNAAHFNNVTVTDLGTLPGYVNSYALSINNSGQAVGYSVTASGIVTHATLFSNGSVTDLGTLGGSTSIAYSINNSSQVVGNASMANGYYHAALFGNGTVTDLGTLGGAYSSALSINSSGQAVGDSVTASGRSHAALFSNGQVIDLGTLPGGATSSALSINSSGQAVGYAYTASGFQHAALFSNGQVIDLGALPGFPYSVANSINSSGQAVGYAYTPSYDEVAVLYSNGTVTDLNSLIDPALSLNLTVATGINDVGQIVCNGMINGQYQAYLLTPSAFSSTDKVLVIGGGVTIGNYSTIQTAYDQCQDQDIIETLATTFVESPNFNSPMTVVLKGGYDAAFGSQGGMTTVQGTVTVSTGALIADRLIIAPSATQAMAGIWTGLFYSDVLYQTLDVVGIIAESGNARFVNISEGLQYSGVVSPSVNSFSTTATAYAPPGLVFLDGSQVGTVNISGSFTPEDFINGTYNGVGDYGSFILDYSSLYERPSSFALANGSWSGNVSGYTNSVTVDSCGIITGDSTSGCTYTGNIGIIDSLYNAYNVTLNINNCGTQNGLYSGLAALADTVTMNDTVIISVSNTSNSFVASFMRQ